MRPPTRMSLVGCRKQRDQIHAELIKDMPFVFAPGVPALTVMLVGDCQDGIESPPPIPVNDGEPSATRFEKSSAPQSSLTPRAPTGKALVDLFRLAPRKLTKTCSTSLFAVIRSPHAAGHAEATVDRHFRSLTGFQVSSAFMSEACWS